MEFLNSLIEIMSKAIILVGSLFACYGAVNLGLAIKDHQGPAIGSALSQMAGAAIIIYAGVKMASMTFGG